MTKFSALAVFVLALAIRLFYVQGIEAYPKFELIKNRLDDQVVFDLWAKTLVAGESFDYAVSGHEFATWASLKPGVYPQGPLYPWTLTLYYKIFGFHYDGFRIAQMLLGSLACALLVFLARRFLNEGGAFLCGVGMALYGPIVFYESTFLRAGVFHSAAVVALLLLVLTAERGSGAWGFATGLALGIGVLLRANYLLFVIAALVWLAVITRESVTKGTRQRFSPVIQVVCGLLLAILPVAGINTLRHGGPAFLSSNGPYILFVGNAHDASGTGAGTSPYYDEVKASGPIEDISLTREILLDISRHPAQWIRLMGVKTMAFFGPWEIPNNLSFDMARRTNPRLAAAPLSFPLLFPLAVLGAVLAWPARRRFALLYLFAGSYAAATILFYVLGRLRQPVVPALLIFAVFALQRAAIAARSRQPLLPVLAMVALSLGFFLLPAPQLRFTDYGMAGAAYTSLGNDHQRDLHLRDAVDAYTEALMLFPEHTEAAAKVEQLLGAQLTQNPSPEVVRRCDAARRSAEGGQVEEAIALLEDVIRDAPESSLPRHYLANVHYLRGDLAAAESRLEEALAKDPTDIGIRRALAALRRELAL